MAASARLLTVNIGMDCVHVLEGSLKGDLSVKQLFTIANTGEFFTSVPENSIVNLSGLVRLIATECKKHSVLCRRVIVGLPFGITTTFEQAEGHNTLQSTFSRFKGEGEQDKKKNDQAGKAKTKIGPDQMSSSVSWGTYPGDDMTLLSKSNTVANSYMLQAFAKEFYRHGYNLAGIVDVTGALLPFRQTDSAGFDAQGKIMIDFSDSTTIVSLYRDVPISAEVMQKTEPEAIPLSVVDLVERRQRITGKSPRVYISGSQLKDLKLYVQVLDALLSNGFKISDLYDAHQQSAEVKDGDDAQFDDARITPDYGVNLGMLMIQPGKSTMLSPSVDFGSVLERYAKGIGSGGVGIAAAVLALSLVGAGLRVVNLVQMRTNPSNVSLYQSQLSSMKQKQASMNETIEILSQTDSTVLDLLSFIKTYDSERVKVISMDTLDMLQVSGDTVVAGPNSFAVSGGSTGATSSTSPQDSTNSDGPTVSSDGTTVSSDGTTVSGESAPSGTMRSREAIIMRGYAKTGAEAVNYFQRLFNSGLVTDPILNGVERQILPDGDEVYVFEIQIGGGF